VVLIGLAGVGRETVRRHLALAATGALAMVLSFLPGWLPAGRVMAAFPLLFPSRLVASDNKAMIAVALLLLSAFGWSRIADGTARRPLPVAAILGLLLIAGLALAPQSTPIPPARTPWLVVALVVLTVGVVTARSQLGPRLLFGVVLLFTLVEGTRVIVEMEIFPGVSTWALPPDQVPERALHDRQARDLRQQLDTPPAVRPARLPEVDPANALRGGHPDDGLAHLGTFYSLGDFSSFITTARFNIIGDPRLREVMLQPWTARVYNCDELDCSGKEIEIPELAGRESTRVRTTSYGLDEIRYRVDLDERSLMIENETYARGWEPDRSDITPVSVGATLRGWVLPAGRYEFTASYATPERGLQLGVAGLALAMWLIALAIYLRTERRLRSLPSLRPLARERRTAPSP